ncbi:hypothetical protein RQP46_004873 [Phenoliferia psychrophenolica]
MSRPSVAQPGSTSASLQYGILVNLHSLRVAATAFPAFCKDALSLDLILSRRDRGVPIQSTITPAPLISLAELPIEILLLIRRHLRDSHLDTTPNLFLEAHAGFFDSSDWDGEDQSELDESECECPVVDGTFSCSAEMWEVHDDGDCDYCFEFIWEDTYDTRKDVDLIRRLLRSYGLAYTFKDVIDAEGTVPRDYCVAITLPSTVLPRSKAEPPPPDSAHSYHPPLYESPIPCAVTATFYDPSFFVITPQDDHRFVRLVNDWRLEAADKSAGGGVSVSGASPAFMLLHSTLAHEF